MHPDLEAVVAVDEEGRSRVTAAEQRRAATVAAAKAECDTAIATRRAAALAALNDEISAIRREGAIRAAEARERNAAYLRLLAAAGESAFEDAAEHYTHIVLRP